MSCCFPWKPAYNEETNSLHYMKVENVVIFLADLSTFMMICIQDNQLLDSDDPCLTMTIRSRYKLILRV